jgi:hypothetical protein
MMASKHVFIRNIKIKSILFLIGFLIQQQFVLAQKIETLTIKEFYPLPGKKNPLHTDISASAVFSASPDSLYFEVDVIDDFVKFYNGNEQTDQVQISFALPDVGFNDYIVGEKGGKQFIFRNSNDAGDNADVERFIKNGDYPSGKLKNLETGASATPEVPSIKTLRRQQINFGISKFALFADGKRAIQLEREKYSPFENQIGDKLDDLSDAVRYISTKKPGGYHLSIAMSNKALGFARVALMNNLSFVIDVLDVDETPSEVETISSTPNRFMGRPSYFNKVVLPFSFNISLDGIPNEIIENVAVKIEVFRVGNAWKPFTYNNGPIIYAQDFISEAGLIEFVFFPQKVNYSISDNPKCETLQIIYDDLALYNQHEHYFLINKQVLSSKGFRFNKSNMNDFVNHPFVLPDSSLGLVLYDFEMVDPLGWGKLGNTADEFVFIQKLELDNSSSIFSIGMRIDAAETITIGEKNPLSFKNVKDVNFKWIEKGKSFSVLIKRIPSIYDEEIKFIILPNLEVEMFR